MDFNLDDLMGDGKEGKDAEAALSATLESMLRASGMMLLASRLNSLGRIPDFDKDRLSAFRDFVEKSKTAAKNVVEQFGSHSPVLVLIGNGGDIAYAEVSPFFESDRTKEVFSRIISDMVVQTPTYGLILVVEGWTTAVKDGDPDAASLLSGEKRVSDLPDDKRDEGLSFYCETREGLRISTFISFVRSGGAVIAFKDGEDNEFAKDEETGGRLQSFWRRGRKTAFGSALN